MITLKMMEMKKKFKKRMGSWCAMLRKIGQKLKCNNKLQKLKLINLRLK